jgi:hypothetical protein
MITEKEIRNIVEKVINESLLKEEATLAELPGVISAQAAVRKPLLDLKRLAASKPELVAQFLVGMHAILRPGKKITDLNPFLVKAQNAAMAKEKEPEPAMKKDTAEV